MKDERGGRLGQLSSPPGPPPPRPHQSFSHYPAMPAPLRVSLVTLGEKSCSYLPGRPSEMRAFWAEQLPPDGYHQLMDSGFRRSGKVVYQPSCRGCRACQSIRVPVARFKPDKSQRRCWRRNQDLRAGLGEPVATDEKYDLYRRYVTQWHGRDGGDEDRASFESFLYDSPVDTVEFTYRDTDGRLLAVGICDLCPRSLSSVYFYFDPAEAKRGLGTYGALYEIETAARLGVPYYYLGYWVEACAAMRYKADFRPAEVLCPDGAWRPLGTDPVPQRPGTPPA